MLQLFGQMLKLPFEVFVHSMEMVTKTMQGIQQIAYQGIDMLADGGRQSPVATSKDHGRGTPTVRDDTIDTGAEIAPQTRPKEHIRMADKNLSGEDLKLVRYKILFIKRDYEHAFNEQEELVYDNLTEGAFAAWKIGEFIQALGKNKYPYPEKWDKNAELKKHKNSSGHLTGLPEDDKKYLRVYFEVLERYPREPLRYQEEQLDILRGIRDTLTTRPAGS